MNQERILKFHSYSGIDGIEDRVKIGTIERTLNAPSVSRTINYHSFKEEFIRQP